MSDHLQALSDDLEATEGYNATLLEMAGLLAQTADVKCGARFYGFSCTDDPGHDSDHTERQEGSAAEGEWTDDFPGSEPSPWLVAPDALALWQSIKTEGRG